MDENITKVSEITYEAVADYLRIPELSNGDAQMLETMIGAAKTFIQQYTGQNALDNFPDFVIVVFVLVQDMWDNRTMYVDNQNLNYVIESILSMHSVNLLPEVQR